MRALQLIAGAAAVAAVQLSGSVYMTKGSPKFVAGVVDHQAAAYGTYSSYDENANGFGSLAISSNASYADADQMFAAGFLEGVLTQPALKQNYDNMLAVLLAKFPNNTLPGAFNTWYAAQNAWVQSNIASNGTAYWQSVGLLQQQFAGLQAGYLSVAPANDSLTGFDFQLLATIGDMLDLAPALAPSLRPNFAAMSPEELADYQHRTTACSSLIKVTGNYSDLFFGHSTWFPFFYMGNRMWKHFNLPVLAKYGAWARVSYSSYPGYMHSFDDAYLTWDAGLWVTETTNDIFVDALWDIIAATPQTLFAWQRVRMATMLASTPAQWVALFSENNPETYNSQYQVLNVAAFKPGQPLTDGMLWIVESMPGLVVSADVTSELVRGYWPSYNVPYFKSIYDLAGYPQVLAHHADYFKANGGSLGAVAGLNYQLAPRATIFRRDQGTVTSVSSLFDLLRSNDFVNDPYAKGNPWNAICARGDLSSAPAGPAARPDGCIDTKATAASWWPAAAVLAVNGPTLGTGDVLPPFSWSNWPTSPNEGQPTTFNFAAGVVTPPVV